MPAVLSHDQGFPPVSNSYLVLYSPNELNVFFNALTVRRVSRLFLGGPPPFPASHHLLDEVTEVLPACPQSDIKKKNNSMLRKQSSN